MRVQGESSWAQGESVSPEGRFEEDGKIEVDEEVDSKNQRKKEVQKQLREIERFTGVPQDAQDVLNEKWQQELQDIEQRRNDL